MLLLRLWVLTAFCALLNTFLMGQNLITPPKRAYTTQKTAANSIDFDGRLDEAAWNAVEWGKDFTEMRPNENTPPAQPTQFRILYDDRYLYVGYRCFDSAPDSLAKRMGRRDEFPGDWVEINIDSYHDLRTAFSFAVSVSGVRGDELVSNNGQNWDDSWNPVWDAKTNIDSLGWTAEMKIPFSQLRYNNRSEQVWGLQVNRIVFRKQERSSFQYIPRNSGVWVSNFATMDGLRDLPDNKQVEIAPYTVAQTEQFKAEAGNPFADGSRQRLSGGVDGKIGITRDLILDFTVNPDFGQVEADPGAIRLDGYQVFFQERRPFFIESRNLFDYPVSNAFGGEGNSDLLFYSRRIGRAPHGNPDLKAGEFARVPQKTSILGAAKFSGKTAKGWSIGVLDAVTNNTYATIAPSTGSEQRKELVEPLTNFFMGRLMKDYHEGNTIVGGVLTAVNRPQDFGRLHRAAYAGGADFQRFWKNRWWFAQGNLVFSHVRGTEAAITNTQTNFVHLFQRPTASHIKLDNTRRSLTGTGGTVRFGKIGGKPDSLGGVLKFETGANWYSPQLEVNDIGFLQTADQINQFAWVGYHIQRPFKRFLNMRFNYSHWGKWDFGGRFLSWSFNGNAHTQFKNFWNLGTGVNYNPLDVSNNALRGGSALRRPGGINQWAYVNTDQRKKVAAFMQAYYVVGFGQTVRMVGTSSGFDLQPLNAMKISIGPDYSREWRRQDQFVAQVTNHAGTERTIVSQVDQQALSLTTRLTYNLTPTLTVQYYAQPFLFRAKYDHYGVVTNPLHRDFDQRFHRFEATELRTENGEAFSVDEDRDGTVDYQFSKPDFNFVQFRGNLVVRWEYVPGSELFLVWTQNGTSNAFNDLQTPVVNSLFTHAFDRQPQHIFLVKATYRLLR